MNQAEPVISHVMGIFGKRGGSKKTPAQQAARRQNVTKAHEGRRAAAARRRRLQVAVDVPSGLVVTPNS